MGHLGTMHACTSEHGVMGFPNSGPFGNIIATSTQHMKLDTEINY
jgi:hypothetical protein